MEWRGFLIYQFQASRRCSTAQFRPWCAAFRGQGSGAAQSRARCRTRRRPWPGRSGTWARPVADQDRLFDQMVVVLERELHPLHLGQGAGGMYADFQKGVAQGDRPAHFGSQPAQLHHLADAAMHVQHVGAPRLHSARRPVMSRYSPELICVQVTCSRSIRRPAKSSRRIESSTPEYRMTGIADHLQLHRRFLADQAHSHRSSPARLTQPSGAARKSGADRGSGQDGPP